MKKFLALLLSVVMVLALVACGGEKTDDTQNPGDGQTSTEPVAITLATGGTSGTYYAVGNALATTIGDKLTLSKLTVTDSGASKTNVQLATAGDVQMSLLQSDVLNYAHNGTGGEKMFEGKPETNSLWVAGIYFETVQIVASKDITDISQLKGKTVCVGDVGSGTALNAEQVLGAYGLTFSDITPYYGSFADGCDALKNGQVDAAINTAGAPTGAITDLSSTYDFNLLPVSDEAIAKLQAEYPFLVKDVVPANTYKCVTEDVPCVAVKAVLTATESTSEDVVYEITKAMFDNLDALKASHAKFGYLSLESALDGSFDVHPGAAKYYKEMGVM